MKKTGLLLPINDRKDLDEFEQQNIENAVEWTTNSPGLKIKNILTEKFLKTLHKKMFGNIWAWAGKFRTTNKNLGVDKTQISEEAHKLLTDCLYWIEHNTFTPDEIAIRLKHRLVSIHPFANGNGRHSRLLADTLISRGLCLPVFTWGGHSLTQKSSVRTQYLQALREADNKNYVPLLKFARE